MKFQVGTRVAVYDENRFGRRVGTVVHLSPNKTTVEVDLDEPWGNGPIPFQTKQCRALVKKRHSFKVGDRVVAYGCGDGKSTFWDGDTGFIDAAAQEWPWRLTFVPDAFPTEKHRMHPKQLRKIKRTKHQCDHPDCSGSKPGGCGEEE